MILMPTLLTIILTVVINEDNIKANTIKNLRIEFITSRDKLKLINIDALEEILESIELKYYYNFSIENYNKKNDIVVKENLEENQIEVYYDEYLKLEGTIISDIINDSLKTNRVISYADESIELVKTMKSTDNTSVNYYGIAMITLTVLFASVTGAYNMIKERTEKTLDKILILSISKKDIILGKLLGLSIISLIQILIVILISNKILHVNFGENLKVIILILYLESCLSIAFGLFVGICINDSKSCWLVLLSIIMTDGLIGGSIIPLYSMNKYVVNYISVLSPITYVNSCVFNVIYLNDMKLVSPLIIIFLVCISLLSVLSIIYLGGKNEDINSCI